MWVGIWLSKWVGNWLGALASATGVIEFDVEVSDGIGIDLVFDYDPVRVSDDAVLSLWTTQPNWKLDDALTVGKIYPSNVLDIADTDTLDIALGLGEETGDSVKVGFEASGVTYPGVVPTSDGVNRD